MRRSPSASTTGCIELMPCLRGRRSKGRSTRFKAPRSTFKAGERTNLAEKPTEVSPKIVQGAATRTILSKGALSRLMTSSSSPIRRPTDTSGGLLSKSALPGLWNIQISNRGTSCPQCPLLARIDRWTSVELVYGRILEIEKLRLRQVEPASSAWTSVISENDQSALHSSIFHSY